MNEHKLPMLVRIKGRRYLEGEDLTQIEDIKDGGMFYVHKVVVGTLRHIVYGISETGRYGHVICGGQLRDLFVHVLKPVEVVSEDEE